MELDDQILSSALNFICGENIHICRLCLCTTNKCEVLLNEIVTLQTMYYDNSISYNTMLESLGIPLETRLPQALCKSCALMTSKSYLFQKLCQFSHKKWSSITALLDQSLDQTKKLNLQYMQSAYLLINNVNTILFPSRKHYSVKSKKEVLMEVKHILKKNVEAKQKLKESVCAECGEKCSSGLLSKHMKLHNKSKQHLCSQCLKLFSTSLQLQEHLERIHYPKKLQCDKCSKRFSTVRVLRVHQRTNHVSVICKLCNIDFPSRITLQAHLNKHETNICTHCSKKFINRQTFKLHIKVCGKKTENENFVCDLCNKCYTRKNGLRTHLKIDHGFGNVLSCKWCNKKFDAVSRLKSHIVKHTKERNFQCSQCGDKFVSYPALVYHTRLHTGERPFPCDLCDESFLSASRRMAHKQSKHIGPTHECGICCIKFVNKPQLRKHLKRHFNPASKLYVNN